MKLVHAVGTVSGRSYLNAILCTGLVTDGYPAQVAGGGEVRLGQVKHIAVVTVENSVDNSGGAVWIIAAQNRCHWHAGADRNGVLVWEILVLPGGGVPFFVAARKIFIGNGESGDVME